MYFKKEIEKIEKHYKNSPGFKKFQGEMLILAENFLDKEMENKNWQGLSLEEQAIQTAFIVFDLLKEGKSKKEALVELLRFRSIKYAPEIVDRLEEMYRKRLF
ncbi:MAG: hypothetical protein KBB01_06715 [Candidatus Omnitrophica bacterium]|jgi:hypothetical protein|nr:hypothetical protein [Candidatus Omnitrophota bacterium]